MVKRYSNKKKPLTSLNGFVFFVCLFNETAWVAQTKQIRQGSLKPSTPTWYIHLLRLKALKRHRACRDNLNFAPNSPFHFQIKFHHQQGTGLSGFCTCDDTWNQNWLVTELRLEKYTYVQYIQYIKWNVTWVFTEKHEAITLTQLHFPLKK